MARKSRVEWEITVGHKFSAEPRDALTAQKSAGNFQNRRNICSAY